MRRIEKAAVDHAQDGPPPLGGRSSVPRSEDPHEVLAMLRAIPVPPFTKIRWAIRDGKPVEISREPDWQAMNAELRRQLDRAERGGKG